MASASRLISEGALHATMWFYDADGNATGGTPTAPANGAVSDADTLLGLKDSPVTTPEPEIVQVTAESLMGEFELDPLTTRSFTATLAALDMNQIAILESAIVATWGNLKLVPEDIDGLPGIDCGLIINAHAKKQDVGATKGKDAWTQSLIPLASARWLGRDSYAARTAAAYRMRFVPQLVSQVFGLSMIDPFGRDSARRLLGSSDYPVAVAIGRGNASLTAFPVRNRPVAVANSYAIVVPPGYATGGVVATVTAVSRTVPYTITLSAAPATGSKVYIVYENDLMVDG